MRWSGFQAGVLALTLASSAPAQNAAGSPAPEEVLRRAAANEEKLRVAEKDFSYRQDILVQALGESGSVAGQMHRVSDITYDDLGNRVEKIIEFPPSRLAMALGVMKPDFKSLIGIDPFFLTPGELARYSTKFVERQKIDEINAYVFDLSPLQKPDRSSRSEQGHPFEGRIWIDDQDFQIVKVQGRALTNKESREQFPKFEYYREYVEDKYWFPSFAYADDVLQFTRYDLPIRMKIKFTGYKRVRAKK